MREVLCFVFGFGILVANTFDIAWTTLGTHGGGPISGWVTNFFWRGALALHKRRPHHLLLSFFGGISLLIVLVQWVSLLWGGWFLVLSARPESIVDAQTHQPADPVSRLYFTAYAISTMGNGDFTPRDSFERILTSLCSLSGLGTVSMTVTFLMSVLSAVVVTRTLGSYISDLGHTPTEILARAWNGKDFDSLNDHFLSMTGMVHTYTEQHLAYPLLQYYHSENERTAASLRLGALHELVFLLSYGVAEEKRMEPMVILPLEGALHGMAKAMQTEFVHPTKEPPPPAPLSLLQALNIPTVDQQSYERALRDKADARRFFAGLLKDDGWPWERIWTGSKIEPPDVGSAR